MTAMTPEDWEKFREEWQAERRPSLDGRVLPALSPDDDDAEGDDP
jgi:hypothetical protein